MADSMLPPEMIATFTFVLGSWSARKRNPAVATAPLGSATVLGLVGEKFHGLADFVFGHGDDVVDKTLHVIEVDGADALGAQSVGDGACDLVSGVAHDFPGAQAGLCVGGEFWFDSEDVDRGLGRA